MFLLAIGIFIILISVANSTIPYDSFKRWGNMQWEKRKKIDVVLIIISSLYFFYTDFNSYSYENAVISFAIISSMCILIANVLILSFDTERENVFRALRIIAFVCYVVAAMFLAIFFIFGGTVVIR